MVTFFSSSRVPIFTSKVSGKYLEDEQALDELGDKRKVFVVLTESRVGAGEGEGAVSFKRVVSNNISCPFEGCEQRFPDKEVAVTGESNFIPDLTLYCSGLATSHQPHSIPLQVARRCRRRWDVRQLRETSLQPRPQQGHGFKRPGLGGAPGAARQGGGPRRTAGEAIPGGFPEAAQLLQESISLFRLLRRLRAQFLSPGHPLLDFMPGLFELWARRWLWGGGCLDGWHSAFSWHTPLQSSLVCFIQVVIIIVAVLSLSRNCNSEKLSCNLLLAFWATMLTIL